MNADLRPVDPAEAHDEAASASPVPPATATSRRLQVLLPAAIIAIGLLGAVALVALRPTAEKAIPEILPPLVRAATVEPGDLKLFIDTQGTVVPRTESELVAEVSGRILWISPALVAGGFFDAGEPLARLDARDYEVAVRQAEARLAQRRSEARLAQRNLERHVRLFDKGVTSDSIRDESENAAAVARAAVADARATLERSQIDLERTTLRAPYDGRVRRASIDVGQFVGRGTPLATVYAVDYAEVRLPIPDEDLAPLGLGVDYEAGEERATGANVTLTAGLAGRTLSWPARVVRTEGELDPQTRMVTVVARVDDPYARQESSQAEPLPVGLFVSARIEGREVSDAVVLPRSALRGFDRVLVVDDEDRLRFREVQVLRRGHQEVVVGGGLEPGERVCLSPLEAITDGMRVRVAVPSGDRDRS